MPASSTPAPSTTQTEDPSTEIRGVFGEYLNALSAKDSERALAVTASKAVAQWEEYRKHALSSTEAQLAALPVGQRVTVYGLRAVVDPAALRSGDGRAVMAFAIKQGLITISTSTKQVSADGTTTVNETRPQLTRLVLGGDSATGEIGSGDPSAPANTTPLKIAFQRENGEWKADPTSMTEYATAVLEQVASKKGVTADQVITEALTTQFGAARAAELRKPVG